MFPLPANRFHFLSKDIPFGLNEEQILSFKSYFSLDISLKCSTPNKSKASFVQYPTLLTTEEVFLLVSILNPSQISNLIALPQEEDHEINIIQLNIPVAVNVGIQYKSFDQYEITFADNQPFSAEQIYKQVIECSLKQIKSNECILATFSKTDVDSTIIGKFNEDNAVVAYIPDESTIEDDYNSAYVEIFFPEKIDDTLFNKYRKNLLEYYKTVQISICKKCKLYFCPSGKDQECYTYYHKGQQIPFDSGEMEEIVDDGDGEEPYILVNYSCCGECPKDEVVLSCGKKENGKHGADNKEKVSSFDIKIAHPGDIHMSESYD